VLVPFLAGAFTLAVLLLIAGAWAWDKQAALLRAHDREMAGERDYWKGKAERLIDAGLSRTGAIHEPTMRERSPVPKGVNPAELITGAMAITEIDSTKRRPS
jgi:hypothetical protein